MSEVRTEDAAEVPHDAARWLVDTEIKKFDGDWTGEQIDAGEAPEPFEVLTDKGNLLVIGGVSLLWELAIGNRAAGALEYLNNGNARIGVGTSNTAEADTNTSLTAGVFKAMDATYPLHTDSTGTAAGSFEFNHSGTIGGGGPVTATGNAIFGGISASVDFSLTTNGIWVGVTHATSTTNTWVPQFVGLATWN